MRTDGDRDLLQPLNLKRWNVWMCGAGVGLGAAGPCSPEVGLLLTLMTVFCPCGDKGGALFTASPVCGGVFTESWSRVRVRMS